MPIYIVVTRCRLQRRHIVPFTASSHRAVYSVVTRCGLQRHHKVGDAEEDESMEKEAGKSGAAGGRGDRHKGADDAVHDLVGHGVGNDKVDYSGKQCSTDLGIHHFLYLLWRFFLT